MKKNDFALDRLLTVLAFQGFVLSILCNLSVGFFLGGGLYLALEDQPSEKSVFVAIMAMLSSLCLLMLAFFVLLGSLSTSAHLRIIAKDEFSISVTKKDHATAKKEDL